MLVLIRAPPKPLAAVMRLPITHTDVDGYVPHKLRLKPRPVEFSPTLGARRIVAPILPLNSQISLN